MKITIEIKSTTDIMPAQALRELSAMIDESKYHEINRKYIKWSGETVDIIIEQE